MEEEIVNIGDKVKIRGWDEMAAEFGLDAAGNINTIQGEPFLATMRRFCGVEGVVTRLSGRWVDVDFGGTTGSYSFYKKEIETYSQETVSVGDDLMSFIE